MKLLIDYQITDLVSNLLSNYWFIDFIKFILNLFLQNAAFVFNYDD